MSAPEQFRIVRNDEEQYSIWPIGRRIPPGWHTHGDPGTEQQCLDAIAELWTDMRPASLRTASKSDPDATNRPAGDVGRPRPATPTGTSSG